MTYLSKDEGNGSLTCSVTSGLVLTPAARDTRVLGVRDGHTRTLSQLTHDSTPHFFEVHQLAQGVERKRTLILLMANWFVRACRTLTTVVAVIRWMMSTIAVSSILHQVLAL